MKKIILCCLLVFLFSLGLSAQDIITSPDILPEQVNITRVLGDQFINIALGLHIPLFIQNPSPPANTEAYLPTNLNLGGSIAIAWGVFLTNGLSIGLDLAGGFNADLNNKTLFLVPITFHVDYFFRFFPFELPLHLALGMNILGYDESVSVGMAIKGGLSFYWNAFEDWSFGLNVMYWWLPEIYTDENTSTPPSSMTRLGNFLEVTLSAMYNFSP